MDKNLKKLLAEIDENISYFPDILQHIASNMKNYEKSCKNQNDVLLRNALGDALTLLAQDRKPKADVVTKCSSRINRAIFSNGISEYHHQGEKDYFDKYINREVSK